MCQPRYSFRVGDLVRPTPEALKRWGDCSSYGPNYYDHVYRILDICANPWGGESLRVDLCCDALNHPVYVDITTIMPVESPTITRRLTVLGGKD